MPRGGTDRRGRGPSGQGGEAAQEQTSSVSSRRQSRREHSNRDPSAEPLELQRSRHQLGSAPAPTVDITVRRSRLGAVQPDHLVTIARRDNPKRAVLFVSRLLGKHLPVDPALSLTAGAALGEAVADLLGASDDGDPRRRTAAADALVSTLIEGRTISPPPPPNFISSEAIVIGYAETATALGHAVRRQLGPGPTSHTTRVALEMAPLLTFSEPHSHAVEHLLFHRDPQFLACDLPVVLVDDELTSGQTALNTIEAIHQRWPRPRYVIAALVDWRSAAAQVACAGTAIRLGTRIDTVALLEGDVTVHPEPPLPFSPDVDHEKAAAPIAPSLVDVGMRMPTARAGWTVAEQHDVPAQAAEAGAHLAATYRQGSTALVVGTEEFMFVPMLLAAAMGPGVEFRSTTRSPIVAAAGGTGAGGAGAPAAAGYPITERSAFPNPDGSGVRYLYNNGVKRYDDVFVCFERHAPGADHPLFATLARCGTRLHAVVFR